MIKSPKGRKFLGYISPIYEQSVIMQAIMEAIGAEWDEAEKLADEVLAQLFPQTATWGIVYWERLLGIPPNHSVPIEQRQSKVLTKMQTKWPVTKSRLEQIVRTYSGDKQAYIRQFFNEYRFEVLFNLAQSIDLKTINEVISETKPAHLDFSLVMGLRQETALHLGSATICGLHYILTSNIDEDYELKAKANLASGIVDGMHYMLTSNIDENYQVSSDAKLGSTVTGGMVYSLKSAD